MKRYLATFSRGIWLYVPVLLLMLAASATGTYYLSRQQYQAVARIWVDKTTLDSVLAQNPGGYVPPPAKQQADKMSQLLQTDAFVADILNHSNLAAQLTGVPDHDGMIIAGVRKQLDVSTIGNNTVKITYSGTDPVLCQQIVQGTIDRYRNWSFESQVEQKSVELQYYQKQLKNYEAQVNDASRNVEEFANENPHLDPGSPAYLELQRLQRELESAQALYRTTQSKIDQANRIDS
nr:hypothetical protein [Actinomycetota bacterium]